MEANEWRGVTTGWRRASRGRPVQEYENIKKIMKQRKNMPVEEVEETETEGTEK